mmetsp:Transcript_39714/g.60866  ORF Transcript_39714/g.60866 Transcript_39714/m.60866 type:complete len:192 (-) Transcript_39714:357-932(-)
MESSKPPRAAEKPVEKPPLPSAAPKRNPSEVRKNENLRNAGAESLRASSQSKPAALAPSNNQTGAGGEENVFNLINNGGSSQPSKKPDIDQYKGKSIQELEAILDSYKNTSKPTEAEPPLPKASADSKPPTAGGKLPPSSSRRQASKEESKIEKPGSALAKSKTSFKRADSMRVRPLAKGNKENSQQNLQP